MLDRWEGAPSPSARLLARREIERHVADLEDSLRSERERRKQVQAAAEEMARQLAIARAGPGRR